MQEQTKALPPTAAQGDSNRRAWREELAFPSNYLPTRVFEILSCFSITQLSHPKWVPILPLALLVGSFATRGLWLLLSMGSRLQCPREVGSSSPTGTWLHVTHGKKSSCHLWELGSISPMESSLCVLCGNSALCFPQEVVSMSSVGTWLRVGHGMSSSYHPWELGSHVSDRMAVVYLQLSGVGDVTLFLPISP